MRRRPARVAQTIDGLGKDPLTKKSFKTYVKGLLLSGYTLHPISYTLNLYRFATRLLTASSSTSPALLIGTSEVLV